MYSLSQETLNSYLNKMINEFSDENNSIVLGRAIYQNQLIDIFQIPGFKCYRTQDKVPYKDSFERKNEILKMIKTYNNKKAVSYLKHKGVSKEELLSKRLYNSEQEKFSKVISNLNEKFEEKLKEFLDTTNDKEFKRLILLLSIPDLKEIIKTNENIRDFVLYNKYLHLVKKEDLQLINEIKKEVTRDLHLSQNLSDEDEQIDYM